MQASTIIRVCVCSVFPPDLMTIDDSTPNRVILHLTDKATDGQVWKL